MYSDSTVYSDQCLNGNRSFLNDAVKQVTNQDQVGRLTRYQANAQDFAAFYGSTWKNAPFHYNSSCDYYSNLYRGYSRISRKTMNPTYFSSTADESKRDFRVNLDNEMEVDSWVERLDRKGGNDELEQNRSTLLMLEHLLLISPKPTSKQKEYQFNHFANSEQLKLVKLVITYSISLIFLLCLMFFMEDCRSTQ